MPILTQLDPVQLVRADEYEFIALAAGRTEEGLAVSVQVSNGMVRWAGNVVLADEVLRREAAAHVAAATTLAAETAEHALLQLIPKVEEQGRASAAPIDWPDPLPLGSARPPSFPIECFPEWVRGEALAVAEALQIPVDLPAMLALSVIGTALAAKVDVCVRPDYYVPLNCYVIVGMESGERKSPAYRAMLDPVISHERRRIEEVKKENEMRLVAKEEPHTIPQLFADDITTEQVPVKLEQNGERLAIFSDEGDTLDIMAGRYSKGTPNFGIYLKAWDGSTYKVDRGARPSIYLAHPLITMGLCVQPSVLQGLTETPAFRGRGLLGRFWFSLPQSFMGTGKPVGTPVAKTVRERYEAQAQRLLELTFREQPTNIVLSPDAHELLVAFSEEIEPRLAPDGDLRAIKDWVAKLEGSVARLAGQLHAAGRAKVRVDGREHRLPASSLFVGGGRRRAPPGTGARQATVGARSGPSARPLPPSLPGLRVRLFRLWNEHLCKIMAGSVDPIEAGGSVGSAT
jgi:hypothetical protein